MDFDLVGNLSSSDKEPDYVSRSGLVGEFTSFSLSLSFPPPGPSLHTSLSNTPLPTPFS